MRPVLVTAGATRNPVDAIRYLSAHASGRTGVAIAGALAEDGGVVHLLGSPEAALRGAALPSTEVYDSTRDLMARMRRWLEAHPRGVVVHSAAVGDYEAAPTAAKLASGADELVLRLTPTPKILDQLKGWAPDCRVVSFKAASPETSPDGLVEIAQRQRARTGSDLVFANVIGKLDRSVVLVDDAPQAFARRADAVAALIDRVRAWR